MAGHALELVLDLVQILVRIIAILSKKKGPRSGGGTGSSSSNSGVAYGGSSYTEDRAVSFPNRYAGDEL